MGSEIHVQACEKFRLSSQRHIHWIQIAEAKTVDVEAIIFQFLVSHVLRMRIETNCRLVTGGQELVLQVDAHLGGQFARLFGDFLYHNIKLDAEG